MKILIITPRIPYPPYRGDKLKIFNLSKELKKNHSVHILTFFRNEKDKNLIEPLKKIGIELTLVRLSIYHSIINCLLAIFKKIPFQVAWYRSTDLKNSLNHLLNNNDFDVIYYHLIRSAQYFPIGKSKPFHILDFTDAVSLYLSRMLKSERNYFKKIIIASELKRIQKYEHIAENFDSVCVCSEIDKNFLIEKGIKKEITILQNGIDTGYFTGSYNQYDKKRIIFTGNMPYYANSDAVWYFTKSILPIILKKDPDVKFFVVGQKPTSKIKRLASENLIVTGYVEDIRKEYLKSAVNIAPMRFGAGTLNKIIESIALGVPVVATSLAVMGLPDGLKKYVFVADSENDFAMKTIEIMNNKDIRLILMKEGQQKIINELGWETIILNFDRFLTSRLKKIS